MLDDVEYRMPTPSFRGDSEALVLQQPRANELGGQRTERGAYGEGYVRPSTYSEIHEASNCLPVQ